MAESTYLTVAEAATACGVSEGVIRGRIQRGTLRSEKIFGQIVILREDLLDAGLTPIGHDERLDSGDQGPSVLASARRKPKNAILGWFVIGALVLAGGDAMVGVDFLLDPLVPVISLTLVAGLIFSRIRRGAFGKVWLLATAIIGILIFFGAIGNAQGVDASGRAVGLSMLIPGVLALIARLRTRNTASETGVRRGRKSIGSGRKWLLAGIGAAVVVAIAAVIGFVAFSGGIADNDQIAVSAITTEQPITTVVDPALVKLRSIHARYRTAASRFEEEKDTHFKALERTGTDCDASGDTECGLDTITQYLRWMKSQHNRLAGMLRTAEQQAAIASICQDRYDFPLQYHNKMALLHQEAINTLIANDSDRFGATFKRITDEAKDFAVMPTCNP